MRYTDINGDIRKIENGGEEGMLLLGATGDQTIYTVQKDIYGKKTVIKVFDCYANGTGSIQGKVFETTTGAFYEKFEDKLCVYTHGESSNDEVRLFVADEKGNHFRGCLFFLVFQILQNNLRCDFQTNRHRRNLPIFLPGMHTATQIVAHAQRRHTQRHGNICIGRSGF